MTYLETLMGYEAYKERLRNAEKAYRFRNVNRPAQLNVSALRTFIGNLLIGTGQRLKGARGMTLVGTKPNPA